MCQKIHIIKRHCRKDRTSRQIIIEGIEKVERKERMKEKYSWPLNRSFSCYLFILLFIYLFGCLGSLLCTQYLLLCRAGFSLVVARMLSSCSAWAYLSHSTWDLTSLTRDRTCFPCIGRQILNHWTTREVPSCYLNSSRA